MSNSDLTVCFDDFTDVKICLDDITITFKFLTGKVVTLTCPKDTTIKEIREWLQDREGIPTWMSVFIYNGIRLEDTDNLEKFDIKDKDIVHVILRRGYPVKN